MAFLTVEEFRKLNLTASATEITSEMVTDCLDTANDTLIALCGETVVTEVETANNTNDIKVRRFRKAQDKLAFREMLLKMSSRFRSGGIQVSEKDTGTESSNTYEKFTETENRRKVLLDEAIDLLSPYLMPEEVVVLFDDESPGTESVSNQYVW